MDSERGSIQIGMVLRVAAARAPKTLAVWRLIWAVVASVIIAVAAHPAANAALTRYTSKNIRRDANFHREEILQGLYFLRKCF